MKKMFSTLAVFTAAIVSLTAAEVIQLPAPDKTGGKPLMQALTERQTNRDFKKDALALQDISNLFYAACGINRADSGKLTCVSAYGVEGTRALVERLHGEALSALEVFGPRAGFFRELVDSMVNRTK